MLVFAVSQDIPGQKQAESALDTLAGQGILGSLCILLILALFVSIKALLKAKDDRFNDQKLMIEALQKHNEAAKELAVEMNRSASNLVLEATKSHDLVKNTLFSQERSLDDLVKIIGDLKGEAIHLRITASNFKYNNEKG